MDESLELPSVPANRRQKDMTLYKMTDGYSAVEACKIIKNQFDVNPSNSKTPKVSNFLRNDKFQVNQRRWNAHSSLVTSRPYCAQSFLKPFDRVSAHATTQMV